jgi:hypothetical protein
MKNNIPLVRNLDAIYHVEIFLVCAVAAILGIRLFLHLTGYPQIGNGTLHIAHMLWGGLLMLVSILILFSFMGRRVEIWAAILGGAGFGTFIDEVGKFVTKDNDYFFEPSVAIMYMVFVLIILAVHTIKSGWTFTQREYLLNAIRGLEEVVLMDLDQDEKSKVMLYLGKSDPNDPLTAAVKDVMMKTEAVGPAKPGLYMKVKETFRKRYERVAGSAYFRRAIVTFFLVQLVFTLLYIAVFTVFIGLTPESLLNVRVFDTVAQRVSGLSFVGKAQIFSSLLSGLFVLLGVYYIRKSRLTAYTMFERSVLVSILLTYVFIFYQKQFAALAGLAFNILILIGLRIMIRREEAGVNLSSQQAA